MFSDPGLVELRLQLRDIGNPASPNSPESAECRDDQPLSRRVSAVRWSEHAGCGRAVRVRRCRDVYGAGRQVLRPPDSASCARVAKLEAPLASLVNDDTLITTIAYVTFYGRDQAGNDVSVAGSIDVTFGNFGDPA